MPIIHGGAKSPEIAPKAVLHTFGGRRTARDSRAGEEKPFERASTTTINALAELLSDEKGRAALGGWPGLL